MIRERDARCDLHRRVQAFIAESARDARTTESFDTLGLAIARHQAEHVPSVQRLVSRRGRDPREVTSVREWPAIPTDVFRLARIAVHPPAEDAAIFRTSGTTSGARGEQALSTTATYAKGALAWGRWALFFDAPAPMSVIALTPPPAEPGTDSSLHFMIQLFASELTGCAPPVASRPRASPTAHPPVAHPSAWFLQAAPDKLIEPDDWVRACSAASRAGHPVLVMGASFAFVHLLDALEGARLALPAGSRLMHTGGFKGRSREVAPDELLDRLAATFAIPESAVVGEYGMTELSSQLYEGTLRAAHGLSAPSAQRGVFIAPPWLRVVAVDPETLVPVADGDIGILRFEDLANIDSALVVQTADRGRCRQSTVELLGRLPGAPPRGCSLAVEELMGMP